MHPPATASVAFCRGRQGCRSLVLSLGRIPKPVMHSIYPELPLSTLRPKRYHTPDRRPMQLSVGFVSVGFAVQGASTDRGGGPFRLFYYKNPKHRNCLPFVLCLRHFSRSCVFCSRNPSRAVPWPRRVVWSDGPRPIAANDNKHASPARRPSSPSVAASWSRPIADPPRGQHQRGPGRSGNRFQQRPLYS
jgi:hypothetical protein